MPAAVALLPPFSRPASRVAIRRVNSYQADLAAILYESIKEFDLPVRGKTVLLKPNLVGLDPHGVGQINSYDFAMGTNLLLKQGKIQSSSTSQIDHRVAFLKSKRFKIVSLQGRIRPR